MGNPQKVQLISFRCKDIWVFIHTFSYTPPWRPVASCSPPSRSTCFWITCVAYVRKRSMSDASHGYIQHTAALPRVLSSAVYISRLTSDNKHGNMEIPSQDSWHTITFQCPLQFTRRGLCVHSYSNAQYMLFTQWPFYPKFYFLVSAWHLFI